MSAMLLLVKQLTKPKPIRPGVWIDGKRTRPRKLPPLARLPKERKILLDCK